MAVTKIEFDIEQPFTVTQLNDIGPTKNLTFRNNSDLPHPAARSSGAPDFDTINLDNDAATIYLDPDNGSDANTGTDLSSDAIKSIARAWVLLSALRPNLHIESTASTEWTLSVDWTVVTDNTDVARLQCAAGQTGTITSTDYNDVELTFRPQFNSKIEAYDGFRLIDTRTSGDKTISLIIDDAVATNMHVKFCDIDVFETGILMASAVAGSMNINNNILRQQTIPAGQFPQRFINIGLGTTVNIQNNILIGTTGISRVAAQVDVPILNMDHNTILDMQLMFENIVSLGIETIHSNIIHRVDALADSSVTSSIVMTNSLINTNDTANIDVSSATNVFDLDPLFIDEASETATGLQLFHVGRTTSDGTPFPVNSPAVDIGLSDAGAWGFTYVVLAESLETFELKLIDGYKFTAIQERLNYQAFSDIQGRFHNVWDDINWKIPFSFDSNYWQGHDQTHGFNAMFQSKTFLRYFPEGDDGLWGTGGITITVVTATQIDTSTNIPPRILPDGTTLAGSNQLRPNALRGWIINITWTDAGAKSGFFEILNHTATVINLEHIRGDSDITSGSDFAGNVVYLPVLLDMGSVSYYQDYGTENEADGVQQAWQPQGGVTVEGTSSAEFHFREFTLRQTREEPLT